MRTDTGFLRLAAALAVAVAFPAGFALADPIGCDGIGIAEPSGGTVDPMLSPNGRITCVTIYDATGSTYYNGGIDL